MKSNLFLQKYLFHVHTVATDGQLRVEDYLEYAEHFGISQVIFLEHIRRHPTYDVKSFLICVRQAAAARNLSVQVGFEARLLPDGTLDIADADLAAAEIVGIAEHSFPSSEHCLETSFMRVVNTYPFMLPNKLFVWVHPGLWFRKRGITPDLNATHMRMVALAQQSQILIERNLRYDLVNRHLAERIAPAKLIVGADAHTREHLDNWRSALAQ